jgi:hypothetical protein
MKIVDWTTLKTFAQARKLSIQYVEMSDKYHLWAYDGPFGLETTINKDDLNSTPDFETNFKAKGNKSFTDGEGNLKQSPAPRVGSSKTIITHNYCDKTTWYEKSTRVSGDDGYGVALTSSDGYITYTSPDAYWIDVKHGKVTGEDVFASTYAPIVKVNDVVKAEDTDFTVNYKQGKVVFNSALTSSDTVKATYSKAGSSVFTIGPDVGKKLRVLYTEAQFAINTRLIKPITFQLYITNPYNPGGAKIPYGSPDTYKSGYDFANVGNSGAYIPAFAGIDEDLIVVPFNYATVKDLASSYGAEIRIFTKDDVPCDGYFGTLTAYCLSESE